MDTSVLIIVLPNNFLIVITQNRLYFRSSLRTEVRTFIDSDDCKKGLSDVYSGTKETPLSRSCTTSQEGGA